MSSAVPARMRAGALLITVPLAATGLILSVPAPASAASDATWDRLAGCESGGRWHLATGNGYYGGLQFSAGSWRAMGGTRYASLPHLATRAEQVDIAERLLDAQGWGAWPACSRHLGLTRADASGTPASVQAASRSSVRTAARRAARTAPRRAAHTTARAVRTRTASRVWRGRVIGVHVVRRGETLARIAAQHRVRGGWQALYAANRALLRSPNLIHPGQRLRIPG